MRYLTALSYVVLFSLTACVLSKNQGDKADFILIKATYQNWAGGTANSGTGTVYIFDIKIKTKKELRFDTVWVNKDPMKLKVRRLPNEKDKPLMKNDTITLRADVHRPSRIRERLKIKPEAIADRSKKDSKKIPPPFEYSGAALIRYYLEGEVKYFEVQEMKKLPHLAYP